MSSCTFAFHKRKHLCRKVMWLAVKIKPLFPQRSPGEYILHIASTERYILKIWALAAILWASLHPSVLIKREGQESYWRISTSKCLGVQSRCPGPQVYKLFDKNGVLRATINRSFGETQNLPCASQWKPHLSYSTLGEPEADYSKCPVSCVLLYPETWAATPTFSRSSPCLVPWHCATDLKRSQDWRKFGILWSEHFPVERTLR